MGGAKPGTRLLSAGLPLLVLGAVTVVASVVGGSVFTGIAGADEHPVPATFTEKLEPGDYLVSVKFATTRSAGPVSFTRSEGYDIIDIDVTDPSGQPVPLRGAANQTVKRGGTSYGGVSVFEVTAPGVYTIHLEPDRPTTALVTPALNLAALREALTIGVGMLVGALGLVLTVWGFVRRRDAGRPPVSPPPPAVPPPPRVPPPQGLGPQLPYPHP